MAYVFPNVSVLSLSQNSRFFEAGFNYSNTQTLDVEGILLDLTNTWGISGIWSGDEGLLKTILNNSKNLDAIILNDVNFGTGRVENISFSPGVDVQSKNFRARILVYNSGNLSNFTGTYYSGVDTSNFTYLLSFNENYAFDRKSNGGYGYRHNATIQFNSGVGNLASTVAAQNAAKSLFTGSNLGMAFYSGYTNKQGKRFYTESYNLINNECNFGETFEFDADSGNYSTVRTNAFTIDPYGIINVSENAIIRGIENPNFEKATAALATEIANAYDRCLTVFGVYGPSGATGLVAEPYALRKTFNLFDNDLRYTVDFTNRISFSGDYTWDYTQNIEKRNGYHYITENGNIVGRGANPPAAFSGAQLGFSIVRNSRLARMTSLFSDVAGNSYSSMTNETQSYAPIRGAVSYNFQQTNEPISGYSGINRIEMTENINSPNYFYNTLNIYNVAQIIQDARQSTMGSKTLRLRLIGDKPVTLSQYLSVGTQEINGKIPAGNDVRIIEADYNYSPDENLVEINVGWNYNLPAVKTIIP